MLPPLGRGRVTSALPSRRARASPPRRARAPLFRGRASSRSRCGTVRSRAAQPSDRGSRVRPLHDGPLSECEARQAHPERRRRRAISQAWPTSAFAVPLECVPKRSIPACPCPPAPSACPPVEGRARRGPTADLHRLRVGRAAMRGSDSERRPVRRPLRRGGARRRGQSGGGECTGEEHILARNMAASFASG